MVLLLAYVVIGFLWADDVSGQAVRCEDARACYPPNDSFFPQGSVVPGFYVDCVEGLCACKGPCFRRNNVTNSCDLANPSCMKYDTGALACVDERKSQLVAFLLAVLFGFVGAANFYIERLNFAIPQLSLLIISICGGSIATAMAGGGAEPKKRVMCTVLITALAPVVLSLWWLADVIILASGDREDGDGCPLRPEF